MIRIIFIAIVSFLMLVDADSQELSQKGKKKVMDEVTVMAEVMSLSDQQKEQVFAIKEICTLKIQELSVKYDKESVEYKEGKDLIIQKKKAHFNRICSRVQLNTLQEYRRIKKGA